MVTPYAIYNHPELYFRDGNIILSAYSANEENKWDKCTAVSTPTPQDRDTEEDAKKCVIRFRVHKSLLSMHSKIMEDMFLLPQSQSSIQYDEGTEIVEMPDSAEEIEAMLSVIYGRGMFAWKASPRSISTETDPSRIMTWDALLEMAHKYDMTEVSKEIAKELNAQWPTTLQQWDAALTSRGYTPVESKAGTVRIIKYPEPASVISFCRKFNSRGRAAALYALSTIPYKDEWNGKAEKTGARWNLLSLKDYRDLGAIVDLQRDLYQMEFVERVNHCSLQCNIDGCRGILALGAAKNRDVLEFLRLQVQNINVGVSLPQICMQCSVYNRKRMERERTKFWSEILAICSR